MSDKYLNTPFSIFAKPRPRRIAFLIDPENSSDELIDAIFDFNLSHWGGRYNPIIPVSNKTISNDYWQLLAFCDTDIVYSFPKLDEVLIGKINRIVAPFQLIHHKDYSSRKPTIYLDSEQLDIRYFVRHTETVPRKSFSEPTLLVCNSSNNWKYYRFFQRNFGVYNSINRIPSQIKTLAIDENSEPDEFFSKMGATRGLVFPIQFSELNTDFQEISNSYIHDNFSIVIGDSLWDWIYFWNRIFLLPSWRRSQLSQIYLPSSFLESEKNISGLKEFISSQIYRTGSHPPKIFFVSHDIAKDKLEQIAKEITTGIDAYPSITELARNSFPTIKPNIGSLETHSSTQHYHVYGKKVFIQNPKPAFLDIEPTQDKPFFAGRTWMVDLKIEYHPERFFYTNQNYWWRLPKRKGIVRLFAQYRHGRILNNGLVSIEASEKDKNIELHIPDDWSIIYSVIIGEPHYKDDTGQKERLTPYSDLGIWDKGRYIRGFIELFPSLWHASELVENRFWRSIFESLCRRNIEEEDKKLKPIKDKLDKIIPQFITDYDKDPDSKKQYLARYILNQAKEQKTIIAEIDFETLFKKLDNERKEFKTDKNEYKDFDISEERNRKDLIDALSSFTEQSIFFQGIKPRCKICGSSFWYYAEDIKNSMVCKGCKSTLHLPVESKWLYRLNDLVTNAVSFHGVIPVIWALGHLLSYSRDSFIFIPGVALFESYNSKSPLAEIDLVSCP